MSEKYVCKKCMFSCCNFNDIKRHINKKKPCQKIMDSFNYSDDQLLILTLLSKINKVSTRQMIYVGNRTSEQPIFS